MAPQITLGNCYQAALEMIAGTTDYRVVLVHGRPTLTRPLHEKYGHAWIEIGEMCFDAEREFFIPKETFYRVGKIDPAECFRYSRQAARDWADRTGNYGPWEGVEAQGI